MIEQQRIVESIRQRRRRFIDDDYNRDEMNSLLDEIVRGVYAKDTHFIFELIQNAEDNDYGRETKKPRLRFDFSEHTINGESCPVLLVQNNEVGFQETHVEAICRVGKSSKVKELGYIGEKGIGFKSVFRITRCPYIFSNHFQFCLPDHDEETGLRYIVPQWVTKLSVDNIDTNETAIILPIKEGDRAFETVHQALHDIAPETILFLKKLHALEIYVSFPDDEDEYEIVIEKSVQNVTEKSNLVELTHLKRGRGTEDVVGTSRYWVTEIEFDRPDDAVHDKRKEITSRPVSVAIPLFPQIDSDHFRGKLFAYLPVWQETGLPFIINADFLLVSSREGVQEDLAWNKWLRYCIAETYQVAFAELLNASELSKEQKVAAYGSIPLDSNIEFLKPVVKEIRQRLSEMDCVMVLPDRSLVKPQQARHCTQTYRALFAPDDDLPDSLLTDTRLTCPELDPHRKKIEVVGVKKLQDDEALSPLIDHDWVCRRQISWFVELIRYLSEQKFDPSDLRELEIVPISHDEPEGMQLDSAKAKPLYFCRNAENNHALAEAPKWLLQFAPIAFLDTEFLGLIEQQNDAEALREWLRRTLSIRDFSIEQYCVDILTKLEQEYRTLTIDELITVTEFVVRNSGQELNGEKLPIVLHDGRVMLLRDARKLTFSLQRDGWTYTNNQIQSIVVPENFETECGWQYIWQTDQDRKHFIWLSESYTYECVKLLVERQLVAQFPLPMRHKSRICPQTVTEVRIDYLAPSTAQIRSQAVLAWIHNRHDEKTAWPPHTRSWDFSGPRFEVEWACHRIYYEQDGSPYRVRTGRYQFMCEESAFLQWLRSTVWLPSTHGAVSPSQCFLPKPGIKEVFGDSVPYYEGDLPENIISLLRVRAEVSIDELIALLRENSGKTDVNPDFVTRIYTQLNARPLSTSIKACFDNEALIFVKARDGSPRWCKKDECVWEDASPVLGDGFAYLSNHFPKLQAFFVEQLGVKHSVDKESYAQRWLQLQEEPVGEIDERRKVVERLYQEMSSVVRTSDRPSWWSDFSRRAKIFTQSDKFVPPKNAVLPDDGELRDIFRNSGVEYGWRPEKDAFSDWEPLYVAFGTPVLSASVEQQIAGAIDYQALPANRFVTPAAIQMISAWLREKRKDKFQSLLEGDVFKELIQMQEAEISSEIQVLFRLTVGWPQPSTSVTYPVFWDRERKVLLYGYRPDKSIIAKTIAKGLLAGQVDKDLAHWIELVLGASDTSRLRGENWSVPQQILDLFPAPKSTPVPSPKEIDVIAGVEPLPTPALPVNSQTPQVALSSDHDLDGVHALSADAQSRIGQREPASVISKTPARVDGVLDAGQSAQSRSTPEHKFKHPDDITGVASASVISDGGDSATESLIYADALTAAFNQEGQTRFADDDDMAPRLSGASIVKNPQRRAQKLAEEMRYSIIHEPSTEERRYATERIMLEGPNEQVRVALLEWYNGKCQICDETWPKRDGEPFFAAAYLVERQHERWLDAPGNALCLCAKHFAQWRHAAKTAPLDIIEQIQSLRLRSEGGDGDLSILFTLLNDDIAIRYDERHFLALRTLLEVTSERPAVASSAPVSEANYAD